MGRWRFPDTSKTGNYLNTEVMRKLFTVAILLFAFCLTVKAQNASSPSRAAQFLSDLQKTNTDSERLKILVKLGSYYLYKPGEVKNDLDSADVFLDKASVLSAKLKLPALSR